MKKGLTLLQSMFIAVCATAVTAILGFWHYTITPSDSKSGHTDTLLLSLLPNLIASVIVACIGFYIFDRVTKRNAANNELSDIRSALQDELSGIRSTLQMIKKELGLLNSIHLKEIHRMEDLIKDDGASAIKKTSFFTERFRENLTKYPSSIHIIPLTESSMDYYLRTNLYSNTSIWGSESKKRKRIVFIEQNSIFNNETQRNEIRELLDFLNKTSHLYILNRSLIQDRHYSIYKDCGIFLDSNGEPQVGFVTFVSPKSEWNFQKSPGTVYQIENKDYLKEIVNKFDAFLDEKKTKQAIFDMSREFKQNFGIGLTQK